MRNRVKWLYVTRVLGICGLGYEIVFDKTEKPMVLMILGMMILGTEAMANVLHGGDKHES